MTAIGEADEANSAIGLAIAELGDDPAAAALVRIQNELFDLGADLATPLAPDGGDMEGALRILPAQVGRLEQEIDAMNADLAPLTSFVLPGGHRTVAALHLARAITRRAERAAVALNAAEPLNPAVLAYLNRLSDHLFVLARHAASTRGGEVKWIPGATRN